MLSVFTVKKSDNFQLIMFFSSDITYIYYNQILYWGDLAIVLQFDSLRRC